MLGKSLAIIVASPRERSGTSLLARLFAEFFLLAGDAPILFDTDAETQKFAKFFPGRAEVADLSRTRGQMALLDNLPLRAHAPKIVDITAKSFSTFFALMRDIDLVGEARANSVEPLIVYIPHYEAEDFERGYRIREHFGCEFALAENAFLGKNTGHLHGLNEYWALKAHPVHMMLPVLDPMNMNLLEDERVSIGEFLRLTAPQSTAPKPAQAANLPLAYLSLDARSKIRGWLRPALHEVQRTVQMVQARLETPATEPEAF